MVSATAGPSRYPIPVGGAALPLAFTPIHQNVLVIGSNRLAATRAFTFLEADANVYICSTSLESCHPELQYRVKEGQVKWVASPFDTVEGWKTLLEGLEVTLVTITDTLIGSTRRTYASASTISSAAKALRIPINVSDYPALSTYSFPSTHRFAGSQGPSSLQVSVSTNGHGCRLSGRIKRDIVTRLPSSVGAAVENVGKLRKRAAAMDKDKARVSDDDVDTPLNTPVPQLVSRNPLERALSHRADGGRKEQGTGEEGPEEEVQLRRMRWVHQMSEYYSYEALANFTPEQMDKALSTYANTTTAVSHLVNGLTHDTPRELPLLPHHQSASTPKKGRIYLVGSGPGHPGLLTMAAHHILRTATLILSDKLVPAEILALIPKTTTLHIAKKFPGNAEGAQNEMMELAHQGAIQGEIVVRLKQGDPFVYGRGGEEVLYFREKGFECTVIPGVSSALAGPLMMGIPVTQRGVAESLVMCTGVGRMGKAVQLPGYVKSRSLVVLMGVARIASIVDVLTNPIADGRDGAVFPKHLPIAVIERASSPDQRVILTTLENVEAAIRSMEERPPGMMVIGWSALCLEGKGRVDILDTAKDDEGEKDVVKEWLGEEGWKVREGLSKEWEEMTGATEM